MFPATGLHLTAQPDQLAVNGVFDLRQSQRLRRIDEGLRVYGDLLTGGRLPNAAPAMLTGRLKPLLQRAPAQDRYVVNVGGLDGRFHSYSKNEKHPHVNMSKAALNMMTRTVAQDWARAGIYMTSVDTGWVSHEGRYATLEKLAEKGFRPPLDEEDGAARILDPVFRGRGDEPEHLFGVLLRNYEVTLW